MAKVLFLLALFVVYYTASGTTDETNRPWLNRSASVRTLPLDIRKSLFHKLLRSHNVRMSGDVPVSLYTEIGDLIEYLVNGDIDTYFKQNTWARSVLGRVILGGASKLEEVFGGKNVYIPNTPPLIKCPPNVETPQDKGRLTAIVSWEEPIGYDIEDVIVPVERRGRAAGSRFSGEEEIEYRAYDKEGLSDTCSFTVTIRLIKCLPVPPQSHLISTCHGYTRYGDECKFSCSPSHTLVGRDVLTCTMAGQYDWSPPTCEIKTCPEPQPPPGGEEWVCSDGYNYDSVCTILCAAGYSGGIKCQADQTWEGMLDAKCIDITEITNCPGFTREYAERGRTEARVSWPAIVAQDISNTSVTVTQTKGPAPGSYFTEGDTEIVYEAVDSAGLIDVCTFYVNVEVLHCEVPLGRSNIMVIDCPQHFMYGSTCFVSCLRGITLEGSDMITCEKRGENTMEWSYPDGESKCVEKACPPTPRVPHASFSCSTLPFGGGQYCTLSCDEGFIPAKNQPAQMSTSCSLAQGVWSETNFPGCVHPRDPEAIKEKVMLYWKSTCSPDDDNTQMNTVIDTMTPILNNATLLENCPGCRVVDINAICRQRRKSNSVYLTWAIQNDVRNTNDAAESEIMTVWEAQQTYFTNHFREMENLYVSKGAHKANSRGTVPVCREPLSASSTGLYCTTCAAGYEPDGADGCIACPVNTYQDDTGDGSCIPCPEGTLAGEGATVCDISTCPQPRLPQHGERWECSDGYNYSSVCEIQCAPGYKSTHHSSITCQANQAWTTLSECTADIESMMPLISSLVQDMISIKRFLTYQLGYDEDVIYTTTTPSTTTTTPTPTTTASVETPCAEGSVSASGQEPGCTPCPTNKQPNAGRTGCEFCPRVGNSFQCP